MSYILEALRKADADRERGTVPDLHAQLLPGASADDEPEAPRRSAWRWPALIAALLAVGAAAWLWLGDTAAPVAAVQPALLPQPTLAAEPVVPPARPAAATAAAAAVVPVPPQAQGSQSPAPAAVVSTPAPARADVARADALPASRPLARADKPVPPRRAEPNTGTTVTANAPAATAATLPPAPKAAVPAEPVRVPALTELPDELRRQVPPLAIGGSVYSPQAERRMVVVNGQVFQEGATLAPELQLHQIRPKSAVFSIRGQRFELPL